MMNHGVAGLLESTFCVPYSVPVVHGTGSTRKLAVNKKTHALELGRFSTHNNFHEETKYLCSHILIEKLFLAKIAQRLRNSSSL